MASLNKEKGPRSTTAPWPDGGASLVQIRSSDPQFRSAVQIRSSETAFNTFFPTLEGRHAVASFSTIFAPLQLSFHAKTPAGNETQVQCGNEAQYRHTLTTR